MYIFLVLYIFLHLAYQSKVLTSLFHPSLPIYQSIRASEAMSEEETHHAAPLLPSTSSSMNSLFTPSGLFLVLNLMIFTIALSSKLSNRRNTHREHQEDHDEGRRDDDEQEEEVSRDDQTNTQFSSFQQFRYEHSNPENLHHSPPSYSPTFESAFNIYGTDDSRGSYGGYEPPRETDEFSKPKKFRRAKSDMKPKLKKSWSMRSSDQEDDETVQKRRPSTVREWKGGEEVDARADDFINRFKQQLKLQRMDSFARYREKKTSTSRVDVVK